MKFEPIAIPNNEAQFLETRKFQVDEICRIFRVPPHLVGNLEHATFSGIELMSIDFAVHTMAASAASVIAMAGTRAVMSPISMMMAHNPFTAAMGDSDKILPSEFQPRIN